MVNYKWKQKKLVFGDKKNVDIFAYLGFSNSKRQMDLPEEDGKVVGLVHISEIRAGDVVVLREKQLVPMVVSFLYLKIDVKSCKVMNLFLLSD